MQRFLITIGLLLPVTVWALEYQNLSLLYTDAPFNPAEGAGISLLTSVGAVQGNPDGSFAADRFLNRAEFIKIALASHPNIRTSLSDAEHCFPDVKENDWFSRYICLAKKRGIVQGYPDGTFKPENLINYAEVLKILGELYKYTAWSPEDAPWYQIYVQAAINHKTILPINIPYDRPITRGQMARLASAYRAEAEGELALYREAELGEYPIVVAQSPLPPSPSPNGGGGAPLGAGERVLPDLPSQSRFLVLGERSEPVADATLYPARGDVRIRNIYVELDEEVSLLEALYVVNESGSDIATLKLDRFDTEDKTWVAELPAGLGYILPARGPSILGLEAKMQKELVVGFGVELLRVKKFKVTVEPVNGGRSYDIIPSNLNDPTSQPSVGRITSVENAYDAEAELEAGLDRLVASFQVKGDIRSGEQIRVEHLQFDIASSSGVTVTSWELRAPDTEAHHTCTSDTQGKLDCILIPKELGRLINGEATIYLYGNVFVQRDGQTLQVSLEDPGGVGSYGSVRWTDGSGRYTWIESDIPIAEGTLWRN